MAAKSNIYWETIEHPYYEKTSDWYWIVGIVGAVLAFLSFLFGNILLAIIFILATATVMIHGARFPGLVSVEIEAEGIHVGHTFYPYTSFKSFSIDEKSDPAILVLETTGFVLSNMRLTIEDVDPEDIRDFLLDHLDELYHEDSVIDHLIHYLGF